MSKELSAEHQKFIELAFEYKGNWRKAAEECGFAPTYGFLLAKKLRTEIIEMAEGILALNAPRAATTLVNGIDEDIPVPVNPLRVDCAKQILDRVGIVKKEQIQIDASDKIGIFILPAKNDS
jgi:hypothetical protein